MAIEIPTTTRELAHGDCVNVDDRMCTVEVIHPTPEGVVVTLTDDKTKVEWPVEVATEDLDAPVWLVENN